MKMKKIWKPEILFINADGFWNLNFLCVVNPTPKHAGGGMDSPSDLPSQLDYPAIIMEQPLEEEGKTSWICIYTSMIYLFTNMSSFQW